MESIMNGVSGSISTICAFSFCFCYNGAIRIQNALITRIWHIFIFVFFVISGWFLHNYGFDLVQYFPILNGLCPEDTCNILLIYRLSLSVFVFHILLAVILFGSYTSSCPRSQFQNECWQFKFPIFLILMILSAFVPEDFFIYYGWITLVGAIIFSFIQLFLIVDFAHTFIKWAISPKSHQLPTKKKRPTEIELENVNDSDEPDLDNQVDYNEYHKKIWFPFILIATVLLFIAALALLIFSIILFEEIPNCKINYSIIILTLVIILIVIFGSIYSKFQEKNKNNGLFQASVVTFYAVFIMWNAIVVDDPSQCTAPFVPHGLIYWLTITIGTIYAIGLVIYSSLSMFDNGHPDNDHSCYNYSKINFYFAMATMYITMLLTNWSIIQRFEDGQEAGLSIGYTAFVKDVFSLVVLLIVYFWTVSAPFFCPVNKKYTNEELHP